MATQETPSFNFHKSNPKIQVEDVKLQNASIFQYCQIYNIGVMEVPIPELIKTVSKFHFYDYQISPTQVIRSYMIIDFGEHFPMPYEICKPYYNELLETQTQGFDQGQGCQMIIPKEWGSSTVIHSFSWTHEHLDNPQKEYKKLRGFFNSLWHISKDIGIYMKIVYSEWTKKFECSICLPQDFPINDMYSNDPTEQSVEYTKAFFLAFITYSEKFVGAKSKFPIMVHPSKALKRVCKRMSSLFPTQESIFKYVGIKTIIKHYTPFSSNSFMERLHSSSFMPESLTEFYCANAMAGAGCASNPHHVDDEEVGPAPPRCVPSSSSSSPSISSEFPTIDIDSILI